jgi:hypothetical protein
MSQAKGNLLPAKPEARALPVPGSATTTWVSSAAQLLMVYKFNHDNMQNESDAMPVKMMI